MYKSRINNENLNHVIPLELMKSYFENEHLDTFDPESLSIPTVTAIPTSWDSEEDAIYD